MKTGALVRDFLSIDLHQVPNEVFQRNVRRCLLEYVKHFDRSCCKQTPAMKNDTHTSVSFFASSTSTSRLRSSFSRMLHVTINILTNLYYSGRHVISFTHACWPL